MKGYVQVYTGDGKGKTTAAIGLALRAAGAGLNVLIVQFLKMGDYSEIKALRKLSPRITVEQYGCGRFVMGAPSDEEKAAGQKGYKRIAAALTRGEYDLIIVEEGNVAVTCGILSENDLLTLIERKPDNVELLITGRGAAEKVVEKADLVTEMKAVKHYFDQGVAARKGIEK